MHDLLYDNPPADAGLSHTSFGLGLGQEYQLTDTGQLVQVINDFGGLGGSDHNAITGGVSPAATLVGNANGLEFDLIWDASVTSAHDWKQIESSVISAAEIFTALFKNHDVINVEVGFGEVGGSALAPNALGESESNGYILPNTGAANGLVSSILGAADAGLIGAGLMSANAVTALDGAAGNFFITAAEAKALGLVDPVAGLDGAIGFADNPAIAFGHPANHKEFDAIGIAAHELSEVMGRVGLEGLSLMDANGDVIPSVFTPLDIFRYASPGQPDLTPGPGYFSLDDGVTGILPFNDPNNGGDAADWATAAVTKGNAFDAFASTGPAAVTPADLLVMAALGYQL